jgi:S-formylglutathione hydrolase FrmB
LVRGPTTAAGLGVVLLVAVLLVMVMTLGSCADPPAAPDLRRVSSPPPTSVLATTATAAEPAPPPSSSPPPAPQRWSRAVLTWDYDTSAIGKTSVVVFIPHTTKPLPVLVALHGLGEAEKGASRGARGWIDDYGLLTAIERLHAPPLSSDDMMKLATSPYLASVNAELEAHPFAGLIVVCPYTPNILGGDRSLDAAQALGEHLVNEVLPRVWRETPALVNAASTGIDGVSLGGRAALLVGASHPKVFGVVGSLQAAVYDHELGALAGRLQAAKEANGALTLRILTSSHDFYQGPLTKLSKQLEGRGVHHEFVNVPRGPHSYAFNRGPGVYAMLMFHDTQLIRQ